MGALKKIVVTVDSAGSKSLFESEQSAVVVGRSKKADLRLAFEGMSREHFSLHDKEGILFIQDLGSANGTLVNGVLISAQKYHKLTPKDKIEVKGLAIKIEAKILQFPVTPPKPKTEAKIEAKAKPAIKIPDVLDDLEDRELMLAREIIIEMPSQHRTEQNNVEKIKQKELSEKLRLEAQELLAKAEQEAKELLDSAKAKLEQIKQTEMARWQEKWKIDADQELLYLREQVKSEESSLAQKKLQQQLSKLEKEWQEKISLEHQKLSQKSAEESLELQEQITVQAQAKAESILVEAEQKAQHVLEEARKMARELRDKSYHDDIIMKDQSLQSYEKQRSEAFKIYNETLLRASLESEKIVKEAKQEIEKTSTRAREQEILSKLQAEELISQAESKARQVISDAAAQALQLVESAQAEERKLKDDSEKLLQNSYATALAMATASDAGNFSGDFPELKTVEFRKIEELHHLGLKKLGHLKQTTGDELADVQKKKIEAMAEEEKNLRQCMYERIRLEAQEEALRIKQAAEKSSEEILAQAYTLSKRLSAETQHKYLADKIRIEQEIKNLDEQYQTSSHVVTELKAIIHEGELKKRYLVNEMEQLSLENATYASKLGRVKEEFADAQREHTEFLQKVKQNEGLLRESLQEQREERAIYETQFSSAKKEWDRELLALGEDVARLKEEKKSCLAILENGQVRHEEIEAEVHRLQEEKQNLESLLQEYEQKTVQAQGQFEQMAILEAEMRHKTEVTKQAVQEAMEHQQEIKLQCQQLSDSTDNECEQMRQQIEQERKSLDLLKQEQEKIVRAEGQALQQKMYDEAKTQGQVMYDQLVTEGKLKKEETLQKVREMQQRIAATNLEMDKKEKEMQEYQERKITEAQKEAIALTESVQQEIQAARLRTEEEGRQLLAEVHTRAEHILSEAQENKAGMMDKIQEEINARRLVIDTQLESYRVEQTREIAQIKIREIETLKQREKEYEDRWQNIRSEAVQSISENIRVNLLVKMPENLKNSLPAETLEQFKNGFVASIQESVQNAIYPPNQESGPRFKGLLQGTGKVARKVKIFWLKIAIATGLPIFFLFIHLISPTFYSSLYQKTLGKLGHGNSYSEAYIEREMALTRNRPKFNPPWTTGFKQNYTDNIVYTQGYRDLVLDNKFIEAWTKDCNRFLEQELRMSDETIVSLVSHENNLHEQLVPLFLKINPDFEKEGLARMREVEVEYYPKIRALFPDKEKFVRFYKFKEDYFFQKFNSLSH